MLGARREFSCCRSWSINPKDQTWDRSALILMSVINPLLSGITLRTLSHRADSTCPHRQFVDPKRLLVGHAVMEVRQHHELVELHLGEVG